MAYVPHPLPEDEYVQFIRDAGVGVFYYDAERYYARHAGILGEFLAAGIPVIVPAGCWLAEQIAESIHNHQALLLTRADIVERRDVAENTSIQIPARAGDLILTFDWIAPASTGNYLEVQFTQFNSDGKQLDSYAEIVGHRPDRRSLSAQVRVAHEARQVRVAFRNAYHQQAIRVANTRMHFLRSPNESPAYWPGGAVGRIAASPEQAPRLLCDISDHYAHYRRTAQEFSRQWLREHDPSVTLRQLLQCNEQAQAKAA